MLDENAEIFKKIELKIDGVSGLVRSRSVTADHNKIRQRCCTDRVQQERLAAAGITLPALGSLSSGNCGR